jgi:ribosomal protein L11 methyltransferase
VLVVAAARVPDAASVAAHLRLRGATTGSQRPVGPGQVLVYGGPFDDQTALQVAADLRDLGWPADARPEGGGHLTAWRAHTRAVEVGGRLAVCFPWSEFDRDQAEMVVEIDPGRAFGTGAHPSTRLLLCELVARVVGGESVLDVGCGSGVLAIAAARLGATRVRAVDISPIAVEATKANAERNKVGKRVRVDNTPVAHLTPLFDVIVANLDAPTLVHLAPAIQRRLVPHGWLGLSGLSPAQVSKVTAAYQELTVLSQPEDEDWAALVAGRK